MTVIETAVISRRPYIVIGVPDVGLVGSIATTHIVEQLKMREVGYLESELLPPVVIIHGGEPKEPIRIFGKGDLLVMTTDTVLPIHLFSPLAKTIVGWAKLHEAEQVIGISGLAAPNRLEIEKPAVFGVATTDVAKSLLRRADIPLFDQGSIVGSYALIIKEAVKRKQSCITLLAESHYDFPDPGASASSIEALNKLLNLNIDVRVLLEHAEEIRIKARELMRRTEHAMRALEKSREREIPRIYV